MTNDPKTKAKSHAHPEPKTADLGTPADAEQEEQKPGEATRKAFDRKRASSEPSSSSPK